MTSIVSCPHFPTCSGCSLIGVEYATQLAQKLCAVRALFERTALRGFEAASIQTITPSPAPLSYRNRAKLVPARSGRSGVKLGLYRLGTHDVVDIPGCRVHAEGINKALEAIRTALCESAVSVYDEAAHTGDLRFVTVRQGAATRELLVGLVTRTDAFPQGHDLARHLCERLQRVVGVVQNVNPARGNVIFGPTTRVLAGRPHFEEVACGVRLNLSVSSFFQVNTAVAERAYEAIVARLDLRPDATLIDLYCGVGVIGLVAARHVDRVIGIEESPEAIELAGVAAERNGLGNVALRHGRVEQQLPELATELGRDGRRADLVRVVLNPPRKGVEPGVVEALTRMRPGRIAYLSCEPATLVREVQQFADGGYALRHVALFDMFPQTGQVETLAILEPDDGRNFVTLRDRWRRRARGEANHHG